MVREEKHHVTGARFIQLAVYCCPARRLSAHPERRPPHELTASKFLSFHTLAASFAFNQSPESKETRKAKKRCQRVERMSEEMKVKQ